MNKLKISLALSFLLIQQATFLKPVQSQENSAKMPLTDIDKNHWAYAALQELITHYNLKPGYPDHTFRGNRPITRYEVAALLLGVLRNLENKKLQPKERIEIKEIQTEYSPEIEQFKEQITALQDQTDVNDTKIEQIDEKLEGLNKIITFKPFGSIALRSCLMSTNIISEPGNIIRNLQGNNFQTRIGAGINGNVVSNFDYQLRILTIDQNSFNLSWLPVGSNLIRLPFYFDRFFIGYAPKLSDPNQSLRFTIGKAPNFLPETELLFDEDVSFNGLSQQYFLKLNSS